MTKSCSFMAGSDASVLDESLRLDDVSSAWMIWSGAAEAPLADAYRFAGGPVPIRGLVLGRGSARFCVVRLGRPKVRKAHGNASDVHEAGDVFMYRDSSIAPSLDLRRRVGCHGCFGLHASEWCVYGTVSRAHGPGG